MAERKEITRTSAQTLRECCPGCGRSAMLGRNCPVCSRPICRRCLRRLLTPQRWCRLHNYDGRLYLVMVSYRKRQEPGAFACRTCWKALSKRERTNWEPVPSPTTCNCRTD